MLLERIPIFHILSSNNYLDVKQISWDKLSEIFWEIGLKYFQREWRRNVKIQLQLPGCYLATLRGSTLYLYLNPKTFLSPLTLRLKCLVVVTLTFRKKFQGFMTRCLLQTDSMFTIQHCAEVRIQSLQCKVCWEILTLSVGRGMRGVRSVSPSLFTGNTTLSIHSTKMYFIGKM